jgi:DNA-binding transcriptional ArsR family regulator
MPVQFDDYDESAGRFDLSEGTNAHAILSFLAGQPELGFTPKEIHEATGVARGSVGTTLKRLEERELVKHKGDYWAAGEDDRLAVYAAMALGFEAIEERYGEDWYGRNPGWADELDDLDATDEDASDRTADGDGA